MSEFINHHPWMTFWLLLILGVWWSDMIQIVVSRCVRASNVAKRGWPPPHLDADGDWKPEPEVEP